MRTLHIITDPNDRLPLAAAEGDSASSAAILLLQDGVFARVERGDVYACADDVRARGVVSPYTLVDYDGIIDLIFKHDRVICWH
jgi:sulfur relay protein TusB/DsrH